MYYFRDIYFEIKYKKKKGQRRQTYTNTILNAEKLKAFLSGPGSKAEATLSSESILIFGGALCPLSHSTTEF